ncbi:translocation and assembly module lipoprotein TamL [Lacinutrix salivirga]
MKQLLVKIVLIIVIIGCFSSCNTVKRVSENEHLLVDNTIIVNETKNNSETINNLIYQKPNRKLLTVPLRLHIYNLARPNRDSIFEAWLNKGNRRERLTKSLSKKQVNKLKQSAIGFNNWLKKTGEAPTILSDTLTKKSVKRLKSYYWNNGWFNVEASSKTTKLEDKRAKVSYTVNTGTPFKVDTITTKIATPTIDTIYKQKIKQKSLIKSNTQYKTENFVNEQDRITDVLRNSGMYHFNKEYVYFEMDTINNNQKVDVEIQIKNRAITSNDSIIKVPFKQYKIKEVNIFTDGSYNNRNKTITDSLKYRDYNLYSVDKMRYRPRALTDAVFITKNEVFRDIDRARSYRHLSELKTFKYPNIEYIENADTTLTANIFLTPLKKFALGFDAEVSQSNIQTIGLAFNPSLKIRNIFRGAETLQLSGIGSIGASKDAANERDQFFDINEIGVDLKLTIPRLFSPFKTDKIIPKYMLPSTRISIAATSQTNIGLDKQTFQGVFNYQWRPSKKVSNRLDVFNVQYVKNLNTGNYFGVYQTSYNLLNSIAQSYNVNPNYFNDNGNLTFPDGTNAFIADATITPTAVSLTNADLVDVINIEQRRQRLTEDNLIFSTNFNFVKDGRETLFDEDFSILRLRLESAGNVLSLASKLFGVDKNNSDRYEILDVAFSQYIKPEIDYIKHWDFGRKNVLAFRSYFGIAIPYGNSTNIPFAKSFFAGGANDNRAWSAYNLGPGSSKNNNEFNEANLKLAFGVEQRFNLFGDVHGAIFVDAGNIWNALDDTEIEGANFTGLKSLQDIAVGSGFGIRYDFSFFVFRFDIGFKTYDPAYNLGNRWFKDYNFNKAVYNVGINYPF